MTTKIANFYSTYIQRRRFSVNSLNLCAIFTPPSFCRC